MDNAARPALCRQIDRGETDIGWNPYKDAQQTRERLREAERRIAKLRTELRGARSAARKANRLVALNRGALEAPLAFAAATPETPFANVGDALSAVMVTALSGCPARHAHFEAETPRLVAVGTIGHAIRGGMAHLWGTGVDPRRNVVDPSVERYIRPPDTELNVHALRGPLGRATLSAEGIACPEIYGDPVWFLPGIIPPAPEKTAELGIVVHITELALQHPAAPVKDELACYRVPKEMAGDVKVINTLCPATWDGIVAKVREITACKRIMSASLHGLVIAEAYGIPCIHNSRKPGRDHAPRRADISGLDAKVDHRMIDFYAGAGRRALTVYDHGHDAAIDWAALMQLIDETWSPLDYDPEDFLAAFPLQLAFNPLGGEPFERTGLLRGLVF